MINPNGLTVVSESLSLLTPDSLIMRAPQIDDAVQIHSVHFETMTLLGVEIDPAMIVVSRKDGRPLTIERAYQREESKNVFKKPVSDLVFIRERGKDAWTITGEDVEPTSQEAVDDFVSVLGMYARISQLNKKEPKDSD